MSEQTAAIPGCPAGVLRLGSLTDVLRRPHEAGLLRSSGDTTGLRLQRRIAACAAGLAADLRYQWRDDLQHVAGRVL